MYGYIVLCTLIIIYFQNVTSYKIYQLNSAEESKLLPKIRQLLANQGKDALYYPNVDVSHEKKERPRLKPAGESVFVKRKIPHGYKTGEYEYDSKLNTVFKPLARYHVKKPVENYELSVLKDVESDQQQKDKDLIVLVQKEEAPHDLLGQIKKFLNRNTKQQKRKKKGRFRGILNGINEGPSLALREKSGEVNDPYAPGKLPPELVQPESSGESTSMEKIVYPIYPFYNSWTVSSDMFFFFF